MCFSRFLRFDDQRLDAFQRIVASLLATGADPNACFVLEGERETALYGAVGVANRPSIARLLLDAGAAIDDGEVFYHGAEHGGMDALKCVFAHAEPLSRHQATALLRRLDFEGLDDVRWLLEHGCDPNETEPFGKASLHQAILRQRDLETIDVLLSFGADPAVKDHAGLSALTLADILGAHDEAQRMRAVSDHDPATPEQALLVACARDDHTTIKAMCERTPTLASSAETTFPRIGVELAARGQTRTLAHLLDLGFDIETTGDWSGSALHHAAWNGHDQTARALIERGADIESLNGYRATALDAVAWSLGQGLSPDEEAMLRVVHVLLEAGADANAVEPFPTGHAELDAILGPHRSSLSC